MQDGYENPLLIVSFTKSFTAVMLSKYTRTTTKAGKLSLVTKVAKIDSANRSQK